MAEGTYEYECMRAELLGIEKPDYDEFLKKQKDNEANSALDEQVDVENLKDAESQSEGYKNVSGRLDELHSILSSTQKKITRFKTSCGSFSNLLKSKVGYYGGSSNSVNSESCKVQVTGIASQDGEELHAESNQISDSGVPEKKQVLYDTMDSHLDKLDSLIDKAERAQYAMEDQRKQMKKALK